MTQRDKWAKRPAVLRYFAFKDECKRLGLSVPKCGAHLIFIMPMPKSWSKKKRAAMKNQPHELKPDFDNLTKAVFDAIYDEDSLIWNAESSKFWGESGAIIVLRKEPKTLRELVPTLFKQ